MRLEEKLSIAGIAMVLLVALIMAGCAGAGSDITKCFNTGSDVVCVQSASTTLEDEDVDGDGQVDKLVCADDDDNEYGASGSALSDDGDDDADDDADEADESAGDGYQSSDESGGEKKCDSDHDGVDDDADDDDDNDGIEDDKDCDNVPAEAFTPAAPA